MMHEAANFAGHFSSGDQKDSKESYNHGKEIVQQDSNYIQVLGPVEMF
jgi:hypothetical protein